ncbi:hypothetical protein [Leptolyngbya sp. FACHB-711]|uniref:hypothetical protein n=1 Tax=unclassified Leptolyngbya TaxID=2650499 RepID=UPI001683BE9D|nr:hypothetical protein [Leptolyngbya sp. FACHB-711]MBD1851249.1 hypothetical protein [Cyanobacteria bacterium FACHB-502]MBD2027623.1 hypothetical protein [Leptolyngbya sp. FACHB-711]
MTLLYSLQNGNSRHACSLPAQTRPQDWIAVLNRSSHPKLQTGSLVCSCQSYSPNSYKSLPSQLPALQIPALSISSR